MRRLPRCESSRWCRAVARWKSVLPAVSREAIERVVVHDPHRDAAHRTVDAVECTVACACRVHPSSKTVSRRGRRQSSVTTISRVSFRRRRPAHRSRLRRPSTPNPPQWWLSSRKPVCLRSKSSTMPIQTRTTGLPTEKVIAAQGIRRSPISRPQMFRASSPSVRVELSPEGSFEASPVAYNGTLYVTTTNGTFAIDGRTARRFGVTNTTPRTSRPELTTRV